jgi:hypothetical protein
MKTWIFKHVLLVFQKSNKRVPRPFCTGRFNSAVTSFLFLKIHLILYGIVRFIWERNMLKYTEEIMPDGVIKKYLIYRTLNYYPCLLWQMYSISVYAPKYNCLCVCVELQQHYSLLARHNSIILRCETKYFRLCKYIDTPFWHYAPDISMWVQKKRDSRSLLFLSYINHCTGVSCWLLIFNQVVLCQCPEHRRSQHEFQWLNRTSIFIVLILHFLCLPEFYISLQNCLN